MSNATITEIEDEEGKVYLVAADSLELTESEKAYLFEGFREEWEERFDHAELILSPVAFEDGQILELDKDELKGLLRDDE